MLEKQFTDEESLREHIAEEAITADALIDEDSLQYYIELYTLAGKLGMDTSDYAIAIGGYYLRTDDGKLASRYLDEVFMPGFDLSKYGYFYTMSSFARLKGEDARDMLVSMYEDYYERDGAGLDLSNFYLLLLSYIDKSDPKYLEYLDTATDFTKELVTINRNRYTDTDALSDTDEERNLCELLCLKLEYLVGIKDAESARAVYDRLTCEIGLSGCLRYYHARDKIYSMLSI